MKGITPIIAIIILLLIVIGMAALAYGFLMGFFGTYTGKQIGLVINSEYQNQVSIVNYGTEDIPAEQISVTVNGMPAPILNPGGIPSQGSRPIIFLSPAYGDVEVVVRGPVNIVRYSSEIDDRHYGDMVGWWDFEDNSMDSSPYGNDGSPVGSPAYVDGVDGRALSLNGAGDYVLVPHSDTIDMEPHSFTIAAWIRTADSDQYNIIIDKHNQDMPHTGYAVWVWDSDGDGDAVLRAEIVDDHDGIVCSLADPCNRYVVEGTAKINDGQWHFIAVVAGSDGIRLYVDGTEGSERVTELPGNYVDADYNDVDDISNSQDLSIGSMREGTDPYGLDGDVDRVMVFRNALGPGVLSDLYGWHA